MTKTILLVEDNPITRKLVRFTLDRAGYEVVETVDGKGAVEAFSTQRPALVLLDLLLPDLDGFELFRRLRGLTGGGDVPILAFSGMLSAYDESRLSELGFDDVVTKPIEPSRLLQIVRGHLPPEEPMAASTGRVLVLADDDAVQRKLVALRLQRAGFKVIAAGDGEEALAHARRVKPFAIVSDVLMPKLDGFGLCMAVRNDPELASTPLVLISNSYLDAQDKLLARRAGADELLVRTPELRDVIAMLNGDLPRAQERREPDASDEPELERERIRRMMNQLERQVAMHAGLSQRCSLLSAELSVLSGISEAVATQHDIEGALHQILASCFDAGGISQGMIYLRGEQGLRGVSFGAMDCWSDEDIASFFGHRDVLDAAIDGQTMVCTPSDSFPEQTHRGLLAATHARSLLITPLGYQGQALGALVTMSRSQDSQAADRIDFAQAVSGQISLALALARSFQAKDGSERAARASAALLGSVLDSMAEGVVVSDPKGAVTHWNHAATAILGPPVGDARRNMRDYPDFPLGRALDGEAIDRAEIRIPRPDGDRWLSVNARPLDDGARHGAVAVFRDVTTERAASARLLVSERMASLGTLAAGVGHEINNPLMAVLGNLEMAIADLRKLRKELPHHAELAEMEEELRDAREATERVRNIVRDLKLFSRADEETRGAVNVEQVMESSIRMVWNEIRHRATLVRDYQPVPAVFANESRLGQVLLNLIVNATQAIPEGRASQNEIRVGARLASDGRVRIEVADTGCGMSPEIAAQIFTPFFTTKPIGVGTGLGLAICHQLISALGGEIAVETAPGVGTTFTVMLPALAIGRTRTADLPPVVGPRRRGQILVIDDDHMVATTIRRSLARDHDVVGTTNSVGALAQLGAGAPFDVIFCDLMMPDTTGMELYEQIARRMPEMALRVIFMTGGVFTLQAQEFVERHRNLCVEKPVNVEALRALVATRLRAIDEGTL